MGIPSPRSKTLKVSKLFFPEKILPILLLKNILQFMDSSNLPKKAEGEERYHTSVISSIEIGIPTMKQNSKDIFAF
jgi:hypothetical protein